MTENSDVIAETGKILGGELIEARGELAVAQERIVRVEAVLERWRNRSMELWNSLARKATIDQFGIANSYDDLRYEINEALADCDLASGEPA